MRDHCIAWVFAYWTIENTVATATALLRLPKCSEGKLGQLLTFSATGVQETETYTKEYLVLHPELSRVSLSENQMDLYS